MWHGAVGEHVAVGVAGVPSLSAVWRRLSRSHSRQSGPSTSTFQQPWSLQLAPMILP